MCPVKAKLILQLPASMCEFGPFSQAHFCLEMGWGGGILCKETFVKQLKKKKKQIFALQVKYFMHARTHTNTRLFPFQCLFLRSQQSFAAANDCGRINGGKQSLAGSTAILILVTGPKPLQPPTPPVPPIYCTP